MKLLDKKSLGIAFAVAALMVSLSSGAYAYRISTWPDSVFMTTTVGTSTYGYVYISDGRDTMVPNQTPGTVYISMTQSGSEFTMVTDSVIQFIGEGYVRIRYSPTDLTSADGHLTIRSDSSTVYVTLVGYPLADHHTPALTIGNYDSLAFNRLTCKPFTLENPNADTLVVTGVTVRDYRNENTWSLDNLATLPLAVPPGNTVNLGDLCAKLTLADSGWDQGLLEITYSYGGSPDSTGVSLYAQGLPINTECVSAAGGNFGSVPNGGTVTKTVTLRNNTNGTISLDSEEIIGANAKDFTLNSPSFPLTIEAGSSANLSITFTSEPSTDWWWYSAELSAAVHGESVDSVPCNSLNVPLSVYEDSVIDTIKLDVPADSTSTLSITTRSTLSRHAILIHNASTGMITLESLEASSDDTSKALPYFYGYGNMSLNLYSDSLAPGETLRWGPVMSLRTDTGTYSIGLTLNYEIPVAHQKGATPAASNSLTYTVVVHRLPPLSAGVSEPRAPQPVAFTLSPNPARGEVTIGLPSDASSNVEIYDVLGNLVFQGTERGAFIWTGLAGGSPVANGAYIVRVGNGNRVSSERLMLQR